MKWQLSLTTILAISANYLTSAQLLVPEALLESDFAILNTESDNTPTRQPIRCVPPAQTDRKGQIVYMNPSDDFDADNFVANSGPTLADFITLDRSVSIYAGYTRRFADISARLQLADVNSTLLAPNNKDILALPRKPHEGPAGSVTALDETAADENIRKWVSAHIIPAHVDLPTSEGQTSQYKTLLDGKSISIKKLTREEQVSKDVAYEHVVMPGEIPLYPLREASNGMIYGLSGSIDPST